MYSTRYFCPILMKLKFLDSSFFEKYSNVFYENPCSESRAVPRGQTDTTKLTSAFRNFANAPKKFITCWYIHDGWNFNSGNYLFTTDTK